MQNMYLFILSIFSRLIWKDWPLNLVCVHLNRMCNKWSIPNKVYHMQNMYLFILSIFSRLIWKDWTLNLVGVHLNRKCNKWSISNKACL